MHFTFLSCFFNLFCNRFVRFICLCCAVEQKPRATFFINWSEHKVPAAVISHVNKPFPNRFVVWHVRNSHGANSPTDYYRPSG